MVTLHVYHWYAPGDDPGRAPTETVGARFIADVQGDVIHYVERTAGGTSTPKTCSRDDFTAWAAGGRIETVSVEGGEAQGGPIA